MKISLNWLKDYIDIPSTPDELSEILTDIGLEVEGMEEVQSVPGGLAGLVVGEVQTCGKHPNADRLSVTTVDVGADALLHIVCGAPNVAAGQKVIVARPNTKIYPTEGDPFVIKKGKIRGEVSEGMICGEDEVGLGQEHDGIMVLPAETVVGTAAAEVFDIETDVVYDIGLTPNRSDATSHIGVAKDLLAYYTYHGHTTDKIKYPEVELTVHEGYNKTVQVDVRDTQGCPRFSGVTIGDLKIGPSPDWIQRRLRSIGVRPINNAVDITNYVLHEYGQPLHAYDLTYVNDNQIIVQCLPDASKFTTLDEKERSLHSRDLMVCDGQSQGMCIAGVFGGMKSGVTEATTEIFLEGAHFDAQQIRETSTRHLLRTDAAKCFEKGADPSQTVAAVRRAAALLQEHAGAKVSSEIVDLYPVEIKAKRIDVQYSRVSEMIGYDISREEMHKILAALEIGVVEKDEAHMTVTIPTNKADVLREADVIEEILRIYGFNKVPIPSKVQMTVSHAPRINPVTLRRRISNTLIHQGYHEMMGLSLIPSSYYDDDEALKKRLVIINNTSNIHLDAMRPEMMVSGLLSIQHNANRQQKNLALYEMGRSYQKTEEGYAETEFLTLFRTGEEYTKDWQQATSPTSFYDLKRSVHDVFDRLGISSYQVSEVEDDRYDYGLKYHRGTQILASLGAVSHQLTQKTEIDQTVYYAECHVDSLLKAASKAKHQQKEISKFPSSSRDLALVLNEGITYDKVDTIISKAGGKLLAESFLFDIYRDKKHLGEGKKSYAIRLIFEDPTQSLKDKAIDKVVGKMMYGLEKDLGAKLR